MAAALSGEAAEWLRVALAFERAVLQQQLVDQHERLVADFCRTWCSGDAGAAAEEAAAAGLAAADVADKSRPSFTGQVPEPCKDPPVDAPGEGEQTDGSSAIKGREMVVSSSSVTLDFLPEKTSATKVAGGSDKMKGPRPSILEQMDLQETANFKELMFAWKDEPTCAKRLLGLVKSQLFESVFVLFVMLNLLVLAVRSQLSGMYAGQVIGMPRYGGITTDEREQTLSVLASVDRAFTIIFAVEVVLRILAFRGRWCRSFWNLLDAAIVGSELLLWMQTDLLALDPAFVRFVRLGKLLRLVRVLRSQSVVESVHFLVVCLQASFSVLIWSLLVFFLIQVCAAILMNQLLEPVILDPRTPAELQQQLFLYYGNFWRATLTMFEITFANWAPSCRVVVDGVAESYMAFFLIHRCVIGFAVLSVVNAVFVQQTMKAATQDMEFAVQQKKADKAKWKAKLTKIFNSIDDSGDGVVTQDELRPYLEDPGLALLFSTFDVDASDVERIFELTDADGDGQLDAEEFFAGLSSCRGAAKAIDMLATSKLLRRMDGKLDALAKVHE